VKVQSTAGVFWLKFGWRGLWQRTRAVLRRKKILVPSAIALASIAIAGGIYFYTTRAGNKANLVAGETTHLPKEWVLKYFGTEDENDPRVGGATGDPDDDILTNLQEHIYGTDPTKEDTDGDGEIDAYEVAFGQNPLGEGQLATTAETRDYVGEFIAGNEEFQEFSLENIQAEASRMFEPNRAVILDMSSDEELIITKDNDIQGIERYFEETKGLMTGDPEEAERISTSLYYGDVVNELELANVISKLQAYIDVLKKTPVPSDLVMIHKYKISAFLAGIKMYEIVRDEYSPQSDNEQFYKDFFYQVMAAEQAAVSELLAWRELGLQLQEKGGL